MPILASSFKTLAAIGVLAVPERQRWLATCEGAFSYLIRDFQCDI